MNLSDPVKIRNLEATYRAWYCKICRDINAYTQPIESNSTGAGIPDLYGITPWKHKPYWMEFKVMQCIDDAIPFEPGQLNWLYGHSQMGGISLVNILVGETIYIFSCRCVDRMTQQLKVGVAVRHSILKLSKRAIRDDMESVMEQIERLADIDHSLIATP